MPDAPESDRTKKLMSELSDPPTEDEIISVQASRIADQVDYDILLAIENRWRSIPIIDHDPGDEKPTSWIVVGMPKPASMIDGQVMSWEHYEALIEFSKSG